MRGLWKLTWLEIKIFVREPLGFIGSVLVPLLVFIGMGKLIGGGKPAPPELSTALGVEIPVLGALLISMSAVLSLITIISIYREGGILKRLRATPLRPVTILTAHVLVKLLLTAFTLALMGLAGRRFYPATGHRLHRRQRRADGPLRAAGRRDAALPTHRRVRPVHPVPQVTRRVAGGRSPVAPHLCSLAAQGYPSRRFVDGTRRRSGRAHGDRRGLRSDFEPGVPVGMSGPGE